jgi:hypothetical protein
MLVGRGSLQGLTTGTISSGRPSGFVTYACDCPLAAPTCTIDFAARL